jgi:hypothetical protein
LRRQRGINPTYWNVGGLPVSALPQPQGEMSVRAWDVPEGREFSLKKATALGIEISEADFVLLKKAAQSGS